MYATGGAVCLLILSALLQGWMLSCVPEYRNNVVSDLETPKVSVDSSSFPQIYQRDDGSHLQLGARAPLASPRRSCTARLASSGGGRRRPSTRARLSCGGRAGPSAERARTRQACCCRASPRKTT